ncbi:MAG: prolipoprotein diacylglyceryl transferase family protein [Candidatus Magasanikbacteria bacterium]
MIPYFQFNYFVVGFLTIHVWGLLVATGIICAVTLGRKLTKKYLLSEDVFLDLVIWVLVSAIFFARIFHVVFYNFDFYVIHPSEILKFWQGGQSSLGGFFGAAVAIYLFAKLRHFKMIDFWPYLDIMAISYFLGQGIGRIGCFLIHDHVGILSNSFLAVKFPYGSRFDLGLLESLFVFVIFGIFYKLFNKLITKRWGIVSVYSFMIYAVGRFFLDFLRATDLVDSDPRYLHLTAAQWGMIIIVLILTGTIFSDRIRQVFKKRDNL